MRRVWEQEGRKPRVSRSGAAKMELLCTGRVIRNDKGSDISFQKGGQETLSGTGGKGGEKEDKILLAGLRIRYVSRKTDI